MKYIVSFIHEILLTYTVILAYMIIYNIVFCVIYMIWEFKFPSKYAINCVNISENSYEKKVGRPYQCRNVIAWWLEERHYPIMMYSCIPTELYQYRLATTIIIYFAFIIGMLSLFYKCLY